MKTKLLFLLPLLLLSSVIWGQIKDSLNANFLNPNIDAKMVVKEKIIRIEQDLTTSVWKGVNGCANAPTPKQYVEATANSWVKDKMFEHRNEQWIRYGWDIPQFTYRYWKDGFMNNERNCSGVGKFKIFIEFQKQ